MEVVRSWESSPSEERALELARVYFPEYAEDRAESFTAGKRPVAHGALVVTLPEADGEEMELSAWGHMFRVKPEGRPSGTPARELEGATFYGRERFWTAVGEEEVDEKGRWKTHRVEEYAVLAEGTPEHRERFHVEVPEGIVSVHDAGEYLEFLDARGAAVIRMHYLVARDAAGTSRQGQVRLRGLVRDTAAAAAPLPRYALAGRTLEVDMSVDLEGMAGPVVVDPGWSSTSVMAVARSWHTATLLLSGKVLVVGGTSQPSAELYDFELGRWSTTGMLSTARTYHTATLLTSGKVLVAGGVNSGALSSAELYDPETGKWILMDSLRSARYHHTATLLASGKVLVAGGATNSDNSSAELFDPGTGSWSVTGAMTVARYHHTATRLPSGKVLVNGGYITAALSSAELYDPATGTWTPTGSMGTARRHHTSTLLPSGKVLTVGGYHYSAELYDPATERWTPAGAMSVYRYHHTATLLPSGRVLVTGGEYSSAHTRTEQYNPDTGTWTTVGDTQTTRINHTATLLPNGKLLVVGGSSVTYAELYDTMNPSWSTGSMTVARADHAMTLLPNGKVLVAGGSSGETTLATVETYDLTSGVWASTGSMGTARAGHTATLLPNGKVLAAGGMNGSTIQASAELYEPSTGQWSSAGMMAKGRAGHTTTLLPSGLILVVGGSDAAGALASAELYDFRNNTWRPAGSLATPRSLHTATLLPSGKVLIAGGAHNGISLSSVELYDPQTNTFVSGRPMLSIRAAHSATLLHTGKVLVAGGSSGNVPLTTTELYDPESDIWAAASGLHHAHASHTATLLPSGRVLITGGSNGSASYFSITELYDPVSATWMLQTSMAVPRTAHRALLLPSNKILITGGRNSEALASTLLFEDMGTSDTLRPVVGQPQVLVPGVTFTATGTGFRGSSQGSSGNTQDSASDLPFLSLWSLESGTRVWMPLISATRTSVTAKAPNVVPGHYILFASAYGMLGGRVVKVVQSNQAPIAQAISRTTTRRKPVPVVLMATDADATPLTYSVVTQPVNGTLSGSGDTLLYTPAPNHVGSDSFTYKANDGYADSNVATVSIWVENSAPVAQPAAVFLQKGKPGAMTLSASDADGDPLTYTVVGQPAHGTLSGTAPGLLYTPHKGYVGTDSLTFKVSDGLAQSQVVTVSLWVLNARPQARSQSVTTSTDTPVAVTLVATDADGDALTYQVSMQPQNGTLSGDPPALLYTPNSGFTGSDSFKFKVNDGTVDSAETTVSIEVKESEENTAPSVPVIPESGRFQAQSTGSVVLAWEPSGDPEGDAIIYRVEVIRMGAVLIRMSSTSPVLSLPRLEPGLYQWRVEAVDAYGRSSGPSKPQDLVIGDEEMEAEEERGASIGGMGCSTSGGGAAPWMLAPGLLFLMASLKRRWRGVARPGPWLH